MSDDKDTLGGTINIPLGEHYRYDNAKVRIRIDSEHYSNMAFLTVAGRDVFIDFVKTPGILNDGILVVSGLRVYMPIAAAQRLAETLESTIKTVSDNNGIEPIYVPVKGNKIE